MAEINDELPNWAEARVYLKGSEKGADYMGVVTETISPLWRSIADLKEVPYCEYSYGWASCFYLTCYCENSSGVTAAKQKVQALLDSLPKSEHVDHCTVQDFQQKISTVGGASFLPIFCKVHHHHSKATLDYFDANGGEPASLMVFGVGSTMVILEALGLTREQKKNVLNECTRRCKEEIETGPGDEKWEKSYEMFARMMEPMRESFKDCGINWTALRDGVEESLYSALSGFSEALKKEVKYRSGDEKNWSFSFEKSISKKLIHLMWLRSIQDNIKESLGTGWLCRQ